MNVNRVAEVWEGVFVLIRIPENSENNPQGLYFSKALFEGLIY